MSPFDSPLPRVSDLKMSTPLSSNGFNGLASPVTSLATTGSTGDEHVASFWHRYEQLKAQDTFKNVLLEDIISRYENLVVKHNQYLQAHKAERVRAQSWMEREKALTSNVVHLQNLLNRDPFVLVLIDGDGMIFNTSFLRDGEAGGKQAAALLNHAVQQWASETIVDVDPNVKVVTRVYANLKGLAEACCKSGLIAAPSQLDDFARGFTRGNTLFDFVDVGYGKDHAASKVSESLKLFLHDYHCRQILFGCSHDNGYARVLDQYVDDNTVLSRLTLLEGVPFEKELAVLPFGTAKFSDVFRDSKLTTAAPDLLTGNPVFRPRLDSSGLNGASDIFTPRTGTPFSPLASPGASMSQMDGTHSIAQRLPHLRSTSMASSGNSSESGAGTWACVTKASASRPLIDLKPRTISNESSEQPKEIMRNIKGQRIDDILEYDRDEVQRIKKLKMCNQHYIGAFGCCHYLAGKKDKCPHRHDLKLNKHELHCLRIVSRETPCKKRSECSDINCIYGHRCPFPTATEGGMRGSGTCLNGENCRFPREMHGIDMKQVKTFKATGAF